jgi:hypothetical protein
MNFLPLRFQHFGVASVDTVSCRTTLSDSLHPPLIKCKLKNKRC